MIKKITFLIAVCFSLSAFAQIKNTKETKEDLEIVEISEDSVPEFIPFAVIERVPIYQGCTGDTNLELKDCMSKKVQELVAKNFNSDLSLELGLRSGRHKMFAQFKIDKQGFVTDINTRAPHPALEKEVKRVIMLMPRMEPGTQKGEKVSVLYALPITFMIPEPEPSEKNKRKGSRG